MSWKIREHNEVDEEKPGVDLRDDRGVTEFYLTLSVYRSRFEALPSIGSSIFAEHTVKSSNNATDNGHIYARVFVNDCYGLGCAL